METEGWFSQTCNLIYWEFYFLLNPSIPYLKRPYARNKTSFSCLMCVFTPLLLIPLQYSFFLYTHLLHLNLSHLRFTRSSRNFNIYTFFPPQNNFSPFSFTKSSSKFFCCVFFPLYYLSLVFGVENGSLSRWGSGW